MEFHFRLMDVYRDSTQLGGFGLLQGWLVGFEVGFGCSGGSHDSGPRPRLLKRKAMREEVWMKLKDRVEQRRFFSSSSSTLPPGLAAIINHGRAIGEEGLGFWALKSKRG